MRCVKCGNTAAYIGDPLVENLNFASDGRINGSLRVETNCSTCGFSQTAFDVEVDVQVPLRHRKSDHRLEIDFEPLGSGSAAPGFPVKVRCSCRGLGAKGVMILRRSN
jgi:hypothetical protein